MIPGAFAYHRPKSVNEAVTLLADLGEDARPLGGGHSLIPLMKLRLAAPTNLVDLGGIKDLKGIRADGNDVVIGATVTQHEIIGSTLGSFREFDEVLSLVAGGVPVLVDSVYDGLS